MIATDTVSINAQLDLPDLRVSTKSLVLEDLIRE